MNHDNWPKTLLIAGFGTSLICYIVLGTSVGDPLRIILVILQTVGIGVGSIGIGGYLSRRK